MGKDKLRRFTELKTFANIYQNHDFENPKLENHLGELVDLQGKWKEKHFLNSHPITLELACGKGEYTYGLAKNILIEIL